MHLKLDRMEIICQGFVAFGAGTQGYRISRHACTTVLRHYQEIVGFGKDEEEVISNWERQDYGPLLLDWATAFGRLAAHIACDGGSTTIEVEHVEAAFARIKKSKMGQEAILPTLENSGTAASDTWCPQK
jgi:hypothetical protein